MSDIKRIAIFIAVILAVLLLANSFVGSNIMDRAIIIGIGVDGDEDGIRLTAEIVNPGNGSEQVGTYSKTVSANGKSVGQAIQRIAELTGKEASLGRCLLIVLGQELYENVDFSDVIDYFINSDSFKESSAICCATGKAEQLLNRGFALSQSVSLALSTMLQDQAKKVAVSTNTLLDYALSQRDLLKTGFLNNVSFIPSENADTENPEEKQGYFAMDSIAVFRENTYLCALSRDEVKGFALLDDSVLGDTFTSDASGKLLTLNVNSKKVDKKIQGDAISVTVTLYAKLARTDSADVEGVFVSQDKKEIPQETIDDVTRQAISLAEKMLKKQVEYNFDLLEIHEKFRQKTGSSEELSNRAMSEIPITLELKIIEK
ncbi:MAG: Ger(x)C family spore germination C-terminal domain-containing protein [Firmicutes bacterium]|nr:Ger(x)C family spore germination C-terminal domain-containing protein [Bacillota bacterium]